MRVWEILQTMLGKLVVKMVNAQFDRKYKWVEVYRTAKFSGVSFGPIIIYHYNNAEVTLQHEFGHSIQSRKLGPLYLFVVGIPSVMRNLWWRLWGLPARDYYRGYPEKWADELGGVKR